MCVEEEGTVRTEHECSFGESAVINITPGELLICLEMVLYWPMLLMFGHPAVVKVRLLIVCTNSIPVTKRTLYIEDYQELRKESHDICATYWFFFFSNFRTFIYLHIYKIVFLEKTISLPLFSSPMVEQFVSW